MDVRLRKEIVKKQDKETGEVKKFVNFFLLLENNERIYIKPSFKDGYAKLSLTADFLPKAVD